MKEVQNMSFNSAFEKTVGLEGVFNIDPDDNGNWTSGRKGLGMLKGTKYGISAAVYPYLDIENLTLEEAKAIYYRDYWNPLRLDKIINNEIQEEVFDTGVNMGIEISARILQSAVNFLEIGNPLAEDGQIGPKTLARVNFWCKKDSEALHKVLNGLQFMRYFEIVKIPNKEKFAWGWMKRIQYYRNLDFI
jgi:lysozyme family protein